MRTREEDTTGFRTIQGRGEASVASGTGFGISRSSTGVYTITFDKPFRALPVVDAEVEHSNRYYATVGGVSVTGCTIFATDANGTGINATIHFRARGLS